MLKCICGNDVFLEESPIKMEYGDFRIWTLKEKLKVLHRTVPIVTCLVCNRALIPATSLQGKNQMDPEIQVYKDLLEAVEARNDRIDMAERLLATVKPEVEYPCDEHALKLSQLEETAAALTKIPLDPIEEDSDVKATGPGRRNTKKPA